MSQQEAPQNNGIGKELKKDLRLSKSDRKGAFMRLLIRGERAYHYDLSRFIRDERMLQDLTITELSKLSGVKKGDIVDLEMGYIPLSKAVEITGRLNLFLHLNQDLYNKSVFKSSAQVKK